MSVRQEAAWVQSTQQGDSAGAPDARRQGLYRFETGFGGILFHRIGCWDYPLSPIGHAMFRAAELKAVPHA
jgi:lipid II:glycine glycyltransferase (peptidoglycan interpeptide bridge formation enzyme)